MAASTTLVTFMVRTPISTRSVDLYGSWDNFTIPYPMSRDVRLGREHWTGCHNFENIICDGDVSGLSPSRRGGLKMGGTYWYYYKLNDEIEFHNSIEPATTRCPLLPGQLVNELHVPFAFSGSRRRDESVSSTSSERRTLDPEAKFVNPRPVPALPKLVRLSTSPGLPFAVPVDINPDGGQRLPRPRGLQPIEDSTMSGASRIFHIPRMPSLDGLLKARSAKRDHAGQRKPLEISKVNAPINQATTYQGIIDWLPTVPVEAQIGHSDNEATIVSSHGPQAKRPQGALLLRSISDDVITLASFGEHRRQQSRSRSRGETPRKPLALDQVGQLELTHILHDGQPPLSALIEVGTPESAPVHGPLTGRRIALDALEGRYETEVKLEKRLPTLPNTPSSVYPATLLGGSPPRGISSGMDVLDSHFSATTIDTTCHLDSITMDEDQCRHFLNLASNEKVASEEGDALDVTPSSSEVTEDYFSLSSRSTRENVATPSEVSDADDHSQLQWLSSAISRTTLDSATSTTPTTSYDETESINSSRFSAVTSVRSSGVLNNFQHYSLPEIENASEVTLKHYDSKDRALVNNNAHETNPHRNSLSHSESMQQLLDELSYLSAMIQN